MQKSSAAEFEKLCEREHAAVAPKGETGKYFCTYFKPLGVIDKTVDDPKIVHLYESCVKKSWKLCSKKTAAEPLTRGLQCCAVTAGNCQQRDNCLLLSLLDWFGLLRVTLFLVCRQTR